VFRSAVFSGLLRPVHDWQPGFGEHQVPGVPRRLLPGSVRHEHVLRVSGYRRERTESERVVLQELLPRSAALSTILHANCPVKPGRIAGGCLFCYICLDVAWSVLCICYCLCLLCVCVSVFVGHDRDPCKTVKPLKMPFRGVADSRGAQVSVYYIWAPHVKYD